MEPEDEALEAMIKQAHKLRVMKGVAVALFYDSNSVVVEGCPKFRALGGIHRGPDLTKGVDDNGANYLAVAMCKLAQMVRTFWPCGTIDAIKGEVPFRGGAVLVVTDGVLITAFSGASEDEDEQIAIEGIKAFEAALLSQNSNESVASAKPNIW